MKKIKLCLTMLSMVFLLGSAAVYAGQQGNVYDNGELLSDEELISLSDVIDDLAAETGWNVYALTTTDAGGKTAQAYADDFYDEMAPDTDGAVFLIDMDNREIAVSTSGMAIRYLTDERIEAVLDAGYAYVSEGEYFACLKAMAEAAGSYYRAGIVKGQYNYDVETGEISRYYAISGIEFLAAVIVGTITALAVFLGIVGRYRLKFGTYRYDFRANGKLKLSEKEDVLIKQHVTHHHISRESHESRHHSSSSSHTRSSTHTSSGGHTHGGGSRKF